MSAAVRAAAGAALLLPLLAAVPFPGVFTVVAVLVGLAVLVDLAGLLAAAAARPVLLAAALPVVAIPVAADGGDGWAAAPAAFAATFVLSILLVLAGGRRVRVTEILGGTLLAALLAGLGAGGLVQLRHLPDGGAAWVVLVLALSAAADLGGPLARVTAGSLARRRGRLDAAVSTTGTDRASSAPAAADPSPPPGPPRAVLALGGPALAVALVALAAVLPVIEPLTGGAVTGAALAAFAASRAGGGAVQLLAAEAGADPGVPDPRPGGGVLLRAGVTLLLTAPAAAVLADAALA